MAIRTVQKAVILTTLFAVAFGLRPFTVHDLHAITRVGAPTVSQSQVVFGTRTWNEDTKVTAMKLNIVPVGRATPARLLTVNSPTASEYSPVFSPDGNIVAFQGDDSKTIYQVIVATGAVSVLATLPVDVGSFKFSPTGTFIVFSAKVYLDCSDPQLDCTAAREGKTRDLGANTGFTYTRLYVRHWDTWETEGEYNHLFALPVTQNADKTFKTNGAPFDLMYKMSVASPVPPFGGAEEFDISPDGTEVAFTAETIASDTAWKTGWKVYRVAATQGAIPQLITGFTAARCQDPQYSPDGKTIAYKAMDRPGLESDKDHLNFYDRASGKTFTPAMPWDRSISAATYGWDNDTLFLDADEDGSHRLWQYKVSTNSLSYLTKDGHISSVIPVPGGSQNIIVYSLDTMSAPADLYQFTLVNSQPTDEKPLTSYNHDLLGGVYMSQADKFYFPSNGAQIQGFILYPFGFDPSKKYPLAQLIHGGPEGAWLDNWSYRWNPQLWASAGYVTVAINPHGSSGFGQAFQDAVQHDWGGVPYQDLMTGNDFVVKNYSFVDANNMAACGASYGGFMINWINGHTDRFKALVCHDGLFSAMAMYYASEEVFFNEAEFGPPPYTSAAAREAYERNSPQNFVQNWKTPTLVVHGGRDYRIPISEGLSAFTALQRKGVPSKLLHFPMENHWVLNSANSIMWYENVLGWLDAWTKPSKAPKKEL